ncbi:hypothetical protein [Sphingomonas quercus]|uniref:Uncharacterized protein n=1 Tax=Sphingomonas quercus TaxID=2842451 RepID=A0ABS6BLP4_9SPHN|nr:hypothetical protein [Sphingomonas quercus]MBU3079243.1 hypothetical protein [Sphingomonas quercus]
MRETVAGGAPDRGARLTETGCEVLRLLDRDYVVTDRFPDSIRQRPRPLLNKRIVENPKIVHIYRRI